jgi:hypothetical protein
MISQGTAVVLIVCHSDGFRMMNFFLAADESQVHRHRTISKVGKFCIIHMPVTSHES